MFFKTTSTGEGRRRRAGCKVPPWDSLHVVEKDKVTRKARKKRNWNIPGYSLHVLVTDMVKARGEGQGAPCASM